MTYPLYLSVILLCPCIQKGIWNRFRLQSWPYFTHYKLNFLSFCQRIFIVFCQNSFHTSKFTVHSLNAGMEQFSSHFFKYQSHNNDSVNTFWKRYIWEVILRHDTYALKFLLEFCKDYNMNKWHRIVMIIKSYQQPQIIK